MLPNFLICGVQKGGTTALYAYLTAHPQVCMSKVKEVNFFNMNFEKGLEWYETFFQCTDLQPAVGEASPQYIQDSKAPKKIKETLAEVKLIFCLRNPVDRAYSNYIFNISRGLQKPGESLRESIQTDAGHEKYIVKGLYSRHLTNYLTHHKKENIHIILSEDLKNRTKAILQKTYEFLGVDLEFKNQSFESYNVSAYPKNRWVRHIFALWFPIKNGLKMLLPEAVKVKTKPIRQKMFSFFVSNDVPELSDEDRLYIYQEYYKTDINNLEKLFDLNLDQWKR